MKTSGGILLILLFLGSPLKAQSDGPLRITVDADGWHFVSFDDLRDLIRIDRDSVRDLGLFEGRKRIPLLIQGNAALRPGPNDGIRFFARKGDSRYSKRRSYILKATRQPWRVVRPQLRRDPRAAREARLVVEARRREFFEARAGLGETKDTRDPWFWRSLPAPIGNPVADQECRQTFALELRTEPVRGTHAQLRIHLHGPAAATPHRIRVNLNGEKLDPKSWDGAGDHTVEYRVPAKMVYPYNTIQVRNISETPLILDPANPALGPQPNHLLVRSVEIETEALLTGPGSSKGQLLYHILRAPNSKVDAYAFRVLSASGQQVFHVSSGILSRSSMLIPRKGEQEILACVSGVAATLLPLELEPLRKTRAHLPSEGGDYLVITLPRFRRRLEPLLRHRRRQGHKIVVVEPQEIYDTFSGGNRSPEAIKSFVRKSYRNWKTKPRFLLLVGDADYDSDWFSQKEVLPAYQGISSRNGFTAADSLYGDVDGDLVPEISVGRISVRLGDELFELVQRTIDAETHSPAGEWKRRLRLVVGNPPPALAMKGWGKLGQGMARKSASRFETQVAQVGSDGPFTHPARGFPNEIIRNFNQGSLVFAYLGHADADRLAQSPVRPAPLPVFEKFNIRALDCKGRRPITLLLASDAGAFDRPNPDCLAEAFLRHPGGAVSVIAASRKTQIEADLAFAHLFHQALNSSPGLSIGEILDRVRRELRGGKGYPGQKLDATTLAAIADEALLYNLLGDPAAIPPIPLEKISIEAPADRAAGSSVSATIAGLRADAPLRLRLDRPSGEIPPWAGTEGDGGQTAVERYRAANNPLIVEESGTATPEGTARIEMRIPAWTPPGRYLLRVFQDAHAGEPPRLVAREINISGPDEKKR